MATSILASTYDGLGHIGTMESIPNRVYHEENAPDDRGSQKVVQELQCHHRDAVRVRSQPSWDVDHIVPRSTLGTRPWQNGAPVFVLKRAQRDGCESMFATRGDIEIEEQSSCNVISGIQDAT